MVATPLEDGEADLDVAADDGRVKGKQSSRPRGGHEGRREGAKKGGEGMR